jgi:SRSO17 transposase
MKDQELQRVQAKLLNWVSELMPDQGFSQHRRHHWCGMYLSGLLLDGERKSIQPMAERMPGGNEQNLQQFVNQSPWEFEPLQEKLVHSMIDHLHPKSGVLVLDDTALPKKGKSSVGVARQYCGALGKVSNCQSVVSWHFAKKEYSFPLFAELYLPKVWTENKKKMEKVGVPKRRFELLKKWEIGLMLLDRIRELQVPHDCLVFDAGYGNCQYFLEELDSRGEKFIAQIPGNLSYWPAGVKTIPPGHEGKKGAPRIRERLADPEARPVAARDWMKLFTKPKYLKKWKTVWLDTKSPRQVKVIAIRVREAMGANTWLRPGPERWLILEILPDGEHRMHISNFPKNTPLRQMVLYSHTRWQVEQGYQQLKEELGLDHFEGRSWKGLHHHITLCFMAYDFLVLLQDEERKKTPSAIELSGATPLAA